MKTKKADLPSLTIFLSNITYLDPIYTIKLIYFYFWRNNLRYNFRYLLRAKAYQTIIIEQCLSLYFYSDNLEYGNRFFFVSHPCLTNAISLALTNVVMLFPLQLIIFPIYIYISQQILEVALTLYYKLLHLH